VGLERRDGKRAVREIAFEAASKLLAHVVDRLDDEG
jgi:hypothetical protein